VTHSSRPSRCDVRADVQLSSTSQGGVEWVMRGTHEAGMPGLPATNKQVEVRGSSIMEFRATQISPNSDYWDMATLLRQVGYVPER
jgi:steroid delta-isomerase-like uncharacterized protein